MGSPLHDKSMAYALEIIKVCNEVIQFIKCTGDGTMYFPGKFHLTPEQSIFLAKKKWAENVYCGMKMENRAVTFSQTRTILNGVNVPDVRLEDIQAILNMRDVWKYLIASIKEPVRWIVFAGSICI